MNIPTNLKYSTEHEWVKLDNDVATIGITDYAQSQLGEIVFVDVQPDLEGETLAKGEIFGAIEAVKTVADAFMPVSGEIIEINVAVNEVYENSDKQESVVNTDPYGAGWMIKVKINNPAELDELMNSEDYEDFIA
ncbi:MAG: glycine cleavage system protein GcvH [Prevotellaceae bacterium]|jgi:glycine cleavage system H protein|nr:glycine cleavage system protein GcvH [Prevotellaceae bacterium]